MTLRPFALSLLCTLACAAAPFARAADTQATISSANGSRLRIEAVGAHIVRLWLVRDGRFVRKPSLALENAPHTRAPLNVANSPTADRIATSAMAVDVSHSDLGMSVASLPDGVPLLSKLHITPGPDGSWTLTYPLASTEHLYGLGEDNMNHGKFDRRGTIRDLWAGQQIKSGNVTADYPVPFLISTGRDGHAYGLFFDNVHRLHFDLGKSDPNELKLSSPGGPIDLYVIDGPRISDVIERYTRLTGRPSLPPLWALGYWQSKCVYYDWKSLNEVYQQLTQRGYPVDVMVIDSGWAQYRNNYVWPKRWYEDGRTPAQWIEHYRKLGVHIVISQSGPMVEKQSPTFATGWKAGVFATDGKGNPEECGYYGGCLLDYTNPKLNAWLWPQTSKITRDGVSGWWLDLTEPEGEPPQTVYYAGRPANIHNEFSFLCTKSFEGVQLSVHPDQRPFVLTRCGSAGIQSHHAALWTGDITSDYATLRAHPGEMLNSGLSGITYWTCDTGGFLEGFYKNDQLGAHARLYERWMQFSAFSPITRAHKAGPSAPYEFGVACEQGTRHYLRLRYRLMPYIYSCAWQASRTGMPIDRALPLAFQDDPGSLQADGTQYMFGPSLLVAPVLHEGVSNRPVYFPPGVWYDWDTGVEYQGGRSWVVAAPQNRIPVAVRAGAIIPTAPPMRNTAEKPWDPLTVEIFPSGKSEFTLYRDDGSTFAYQHGDDTTTRLASDASADRVTFTIDESNKRFTPALYVAHFHLDATPVSVSIAGRPAQAVASAGPAAGQWHWDPASRVLAVALDGRQGTHHEIDVALSPTLLPSRLAPLLKADPIDEKSEAGGTSRPIPQFYPAPTLPTTIKAVNYDKGGEGIAFHLRHPLPAQAAYRLDDIGCVENDDAGGGYALAGLESQEWTRTELDGGNGGYFDVDVRIKGTPGAGFHLIAEDQPVGAVVIPQNSGQGWQDVVLRNVYLNPGEFGLMLLVDKPGFQLNTLDFRPAANPPSTCPAALGVRTGTAEIGDLGTGPGGLGIVRTLGRKGSSLMVGLVAGPAGASKLRIHYLTQAPTNVPFTLQIDNQPQTPLVLPSSPKWTTFDLPVKLAPGAHKILLRGQVDGWDGINVDWLGVAP